MKGRIYEWKTYHVVGALFFLSIPTALLFLPPYWHSQRNYCKTLHPEVLTYMKNDYVKNVPFYWEYMLPVCIHLYSWFLWQRHHSWMNVTERNLECTFHCKSALNVLSKFLLILCVQRLWRWQDYTSATDASLCLERAVCLRGYEVQERQSLLLCFYCKRNLQNYQLRKT